jgi:hypothetical protein
MAHNAPFDKTRPVEHFKWVADLGWRDSLNGVAGRPTLGNFRLCWNNTTARSHIGLDRMLVPC